jgi:hypothetical protein
MSNESEERERCRDLGIQNLSTSVKFDEIVKRIAAMSTDAPTHMSEFLGVLSHIEIDVVKQYVSAVREELKYVLRSSGKCSDCAQCFYIVQLPHHNSKSFISGIPLWHEIIAKVHASFK